MFWKFDLHTTSHIDTLLDRDDVTLTEVMEEEDVLQECKTQNRKLVEFLQREHCMEELVTFVTQEPSAASTDEKLRYKYCNISCELLTADVCQINDRLAEDESLLGKLYAFLQRESPLNPLLASFFSKVLSILISRKPEHIVEFLRKREDFVDLLVRHIGTSAIMDLLLRLLTCIEPQQLRADVLNWLNEEKIIQRLVDMTDPSQDEDRHSNASQSLCEIIRLSRDHMFHVQGSTEPDPLLATLEKRETVEQLLSNIFDKEKNESAIVCVIQILLTLFEMRRPAFEGHLDLCPPGMSHTSFSVSLGVLEAVRARLKDFHQLLLEPPKKTALRTTWGVLDPPVGNTRLNVVRLVTSLLQTNTHSVILELIDLNTIGVILDMYFKYLWNNFLHTQVEICMGMILAMPPAPVDNAERENHLVKHLFQKCQLIQRILDAWTSNEKEQCEGGRRRGYMGHLTRIANSVVHSRDGEPNGALIQQLITELSADVQERWEAFTSGSLTDINKRNTVDLVNTNHIHSTNEDESEFKGSAFRHDSNLQQAFSDYQMQQMTSNFIEQFGFNDDESTNQGNVADFPFDRISDINFTLSTNENTSVAFFEAFSDDEDIWEEKNITFTPEAAQRQPSSPGSSDSDESTDSEDEDVKREVFESRPPRADERMEVDTGPGWAANFSDVPMETSVAVATVSGMAFVASGREEWNLSDNAPVKETAWAEFSSFTVVQGPKDPLRSSSPVAMETSTEVTDPLTFGAEPDSEEEPATDRITETVINGSIKETLSLTVDAKTETAVFKRVLKSLGNEETSQHTPDEEDVSERTMTSRSHITENTQSFSDAPKDADEDK